MFLHASKSPRWLRQDGCGWRVVIMISWIEIRAQVVTSDHVICSFFDREYSVSRDSIIFYPKADRLLCDKQLASQLFPSASDFNCSFKRSFHYAA